jgi:hypothetical protein
MAPRPISNCARITTALISFDLAVLGGKNVEELRRAQEELISLPTQLFEEPQQFSDTGSGGNDGKRAI